MSLTGQMQAACVSAEAHPQLANVPMEQGISSEGHRRAHCSSLGLHHPQCMKAFMWLAGSLYASEGDTRASYPGDKVKPPQTAMPHRWAGCPKLQATLSDPKRVVPLAGSQQPYKLLFLGKVDLSITRPLLSREVCMLTVRSNVQGWVMTGDAWPGSLTSFMRGRPDNTWRNIKARSPPPSLHSA